MTFLKISHIQWSGGLYAENNVGFLQAKVTLLSPLAHHSYVDEYQKPGPAMCRE